MSFCLFGCANSDTQIRAGDTTVTANNTDNIKWPTDFPLPQYTGARTTVATDTDVTDTRVRSAMQVTQDEPAACCKFYSDWFEKNGWTVKTPAMDMGVGWTTSAEKGTDTATVTALKPKGSPETTLTINVSSKK